MKSLKLVNRIGSEAEGSIAVRAERDHRGQRTGNVGGLRYPPRIARATGKRTIRIAVVRRCALRPRSIYIILIDRCGDLLTRQRGHVVVYGHGQAARAGVTV